MRPGRALVLLVMLGLLVSLGPAAWSQRIPRATCLECHEAEGMRYAAIQTTPFVTVPDGEAQELEVTVGNPWLHDINSAFITVDLSNATGLAFETPDPFNATETFSMGPQDSVVRFPFPVEPGVTGVVVTMTQPEDPSPVGLIDADLTLEFPGDTEPSRLGHDGAGDFDDPNDLRQPAPARTVEQIGLRGDALATKPTGQWNVTIELASGPPATEIGLEVHTFYNSTRTQSQVISRVIGPGQTGSASFTIKGVERGDATVSVDTVITSYYLHPTGIGAQDEGNATMHRGMNFTVGETLELGTAAPPVPPVPPVNWKLNARIWGEATGFIALFMVPLALVLGGAFGRRNVLWANKLARSARLRVLWHNSLSFWLLGITLLHLVLFLYEEVYDWSVGFVWGGIGTLALIGLAITGGYQRRFARRIGYANWRLLHIAMAVLFVTSVLVHVLVDGAHFDVFRNWLGLT